MKFINESIRVETRRGIPCRFVWAGRTYRTRELLDYWILQTRWWGEEERRVYFRILTDGGVMEVYQSTGIRVASAAVGSKGGGSAGAGRPSSPGASSTERSRGAGGESRAPAPAAVPEHGKGPRTQAADLKNEAVERSGEPAPDRPPLPMEGDTHIRERRRADAVYRPDVRIQEAERQRRTTRRRRTDAPQTHWILSKILD